MAHFGAPTRPRGIGVISIILGLLGVAMCWWTPTGMVLSLTGLVIGFVGCAMNLRGQWVPSAVGAVLSASALAICWIVAAWGMEIIRFSP